MSTTSAELSVHKTSSYQHITSEEATDNFPYICTDCNLCFRNEHHLKLHKVLVEKSIASEMRDKKKVTNIVADPLLPQKEIELTKIQRKTMDVPTSSCVHSNECPICHSRFDDSRHRLYHQRLHRINHVVSSRISSLFPYKCTDCAVYFQTKEDLMAHKSKKVQQTSPQSRIGAYPKFDAISDSDIDKYLHSYESYIDRKQRCPHVQNRECPVCHHRFKGTVFHLHRHQKNSSHLQCKRETKVFKYQCSECKMYFISAEHLDMHVKGRNDGEKSDSTSVRDDLGTTSKVPTKSKLGSITSNILNKVNELQRCMEGSKVVEKVPEEHDEKRGSGTSIRNEHTEQILDNLATKTSISSICVPGIFF